MELYLEIESIGGQVHVHDGDGDGGGGGGGGGDGDGDILNWSVILWEGWRFGIFLRLVQRQVIWITGEEVTGDWKKNN